MMVIGKMIRKMEKVKTIIILGILNQVNGDVYDGEWRDDKCNGKGIMDYANGDRYDGNWKNNMKSGKGNI